MLSAITCAKTALRLTYVLHDDGGPSAPALEWETIEMPPAYADLRRWNRRGRRGRRADRGRNGRRDLLPMQGTAERIKGHDAPAGLCVLRTIIGGPGSSAPCGASERHFAQAVLNRRAATAAHVGVCYIVVSTQSRPNRRPVRGLLSRTRACMVGAARWVF